MKRIYRERITISGMRSLRINSPSSIISQPCLPSRNLVQSTSSVRFKQVTTASSAESSEHQETKSNENMDNKEKREKEDKHKQETDQNVMSHSFGEGYATRCGDDGFGGIYGGNEPDPKSHEDHSTIHENHPDYDKSQGSEVKEKEKARHQTGY